MGVKLKRSEKQPLIVTEQKWKREEQKDKSVRKNKEEQFKPSGFFKEFSGTLLKTNDQAEGQNLAKKNIFIKKSVIVNVEIWASIILNDFIFTRLSGKLRWTLVSFGVNCYKW